MFRIICMGLLLLVVFGSLLSIVDAAGMAEDERIKGYYARNYTWPVPKYNPNAKGWKDLMDERFRQVQEIENRGQRYEGFAQTIRSALLVPNFTEYGFGLARCSEDLLKILQDGIRDGFDTKGEEQKLEEIEGLQPWFIDRPDLTRRVLHDLKHYAETWSGIPLTPSTAYGFRLYRNESALRMHVDKPQTHVISFILHINSSEDADPWPIFIEDLDGRTHEVTLKPGDLLFYESAKCWHGRPKPFKGTWYSSVFVHYAPTHGWRDKDWRQEVHYAIPPIWSQQPPHASLRKETRVVMKGTGMMEPDCPNGWCRSEQSVKWSGPGEDGFWIAPTGEKFPFHPARVEDNDEL